ncbi:hypothetical protein CNYM01_05272 [Colletotrichum nymphaeae SA-01]|uniref:Uncharacterized protein n=1 Tax=Colletotrichum nymphaeae SA-01 TaxID=1460502 RepID=A0A135RRM4_9PEZI|nr:hypothetical protein CNYM01_05272 [Colletotrichum nymphaeae SA-01]
MAHGGNGPWQLPYLGQLQPFEIVASLLDSNDHKKAEPQAQPGKTRILDGNHPPGPLHYSLTAPPFQSPLHSRIDKSQHHFTSQAQSNDHPSQRGLRYTSLPTYTRLRYCLCHHGYQSCQIADPSVPREPPRLVSPSSAPPAATPETNTPLLLRRSAPSSPFLSV